jgi:hypothetical protein
MLDFHSDLDTSWITEVERFQHLDTIASKELSSFLNTCILFINVNHEIVSVTRDKLVLDGSILSNDKLIEISNQYNIHHKDYVLNRMLFFHVPIEPQYILSFSKSDHSYDVAKSFLHSYSVSDSIKIPPSVFIFHSIHTLYFLFQEEVKMELKPEGFSKPDTAPSIINSYADRHKVTKRVRIKLPKSTRKYRP